MANITQVYSNKLNAEMKFGLTLTKNTLIKIKETFAAKSILFNKDHIYMVLNNNNFMIQFMNIDGIQPNGPKVPLRDITQNKDKFEIIPNPETMDEYRHLFEGGRRLNKRKHRKTAKRSSHKRKSTRKH